MNKEQLLKLNEDFLESLDDRSSSLLKELTKGQHPSTLVICCSDSRVVPEKIFHSTFGDIFVIRTAGNVINEGELASVEYGIEHLKVSLVVVLGHTHCGAVHASINNEKGLYLSPILDRIKKNISLEKDEREASIINAQKEAEFIKSKFPNYQGEVISLLYDIETGKVS